VRGRAIESDCRAIEGDCRAIEEEEVVDRLIADLLG